MRPTRRTKYPPNSLAAAAAVAGWNDDRMRWSPRDISVFIAARFRGSWSIKLILSSSFCPPTFRCSRFSYSAPRFAIAPASINHSYL